MTVQIISGAEVAARVAAESVNLMLYGDPGTRKTTDAVEATIKDGRSRALYIPCEPGGLKSVVAQGLPAPDSFPHVVTTWEELAKGVEHAMKHRDRYDWVIVDTLTAWNASMVRAMEATKQRNAWDGWKEIKKALIYLRDGCRAAGLHIIYIAHGTPPTMDEKGTFWAGSPSMQPKSAIKEFVGGIDSVLRVGYLTTMGKTTRVYYTGGEAWPDGLGAQPLDLRAWYAKNRDGVNWACVPADLSAYLKMRQPPYPGL